MRGAARHDLRAMKRIIYPSHATSSLSPFTKIPVWATVLLVRMFATVSSLLTDPHSFSSVALDTANSSLPTALPSGAHPCAVFVPPQRTVPDPQMCAVPPHQPGLHHEGWEGEGPGHTPRGLAPFRLITLLESPRNSLARARRERWGIFRQTRAEGAKSCCGMIFKHSNLERSKTFSWTRVMVSFCSSAFRPWGACAYVPARGPQAAPLPCQQHVSLFWCAFLPSLLF